MCDTILAGPATTVGGHMLFGKNSDRQRNEAHVVEHREGGEHAPGELLACTYLTIPQARRTYGALFCRPFWTWGPEMGANDRGVVIGNEAVHTRGAPPIAPALIGMDLAGLALQRAETADEAVEVIGALLAIHGQGGNCGHLEPHYYNNSYIIADRNRAFVMETVGREWLAQEITATRAISNIYSIQQPDRASAGLDGLIASQGWLAPGADYAAALADRDRPDASEAIARQLRGQSLLDGAAGQIEVATLMRVLRDHGGGSEGWRPGSDRPRTLCMHASDTRRGGQTTGAMVSELSEGAAVHWVTATAAPCLSIFKPLFADLAPPEHGAAPVGHVDLETLWWRGEQWHRAVLRSDFSRIIAEITPERDAVEADFRRRIATVSGAAVRERAAVVRACWDAAAAVQLHWRARFAPSASARDCDAAYDAAWDAFDETAQASIFG